MAAERPPLRFAVLRHEGVPDPHYDLLFERSPGSALLTFRCSRWPITEPVELMLLADHRPEYLEYQGPISGDRGQVERTATGVFKTDEQDDHTTVFHLRDETGASSFVLRVEGFANSRYVAFPHRHI